MRETDWFSKETISEGLTRLYEPHVHSFFRANIFHVVGRDADLVIDFGMGLASLAGALNIPAGKPVLAVATHVHVDHVGSFHEFENRLGHEAEAAAFAQMPDADTLAPYFRTQPGALAAVPPTGVRPETYAISPAPLTTILKENDIIDIGDARYTVLHLPGHSPAPSASLTRGRGYSSAETRSTRASLSMTCRDATSRPTGRPWSACRAWTSLSFTAAMAAVSDERGTWRSARPIWR